MSVQFNPVAYRSTGGVAKAMKNETNAPQCIEVSEGEEVLVPGGWALVINPSGAPMIIPNEDLDGNFRLDGELVTLDAFVNTVNDLRHSLRMLTSQQAETEGVQQQVLLRLAQLEGAPPAEPNHG